MAATIRAPELVRGLEDLDPVVRTTDIGEVLRLIRLHEVARLEQQAHVLARDAVVARPLVVCRRLTDKAVSALVDVERLGSKDAQVDEVHRADLQTVRGHGHRAPGVARAVAVRCLDQVAAPIRGQDDLWDRLGRSELGTDGHTLEVGATHRTDKGTDQVRGIPSVATSRGVRHADVVVRSVGRGNRLAVDLRDRRDPVSLDGLTGDQSACSRGVFRDVVRDRQELVARLHVGLIRHVPKALLDVLDHVVVQILVLGIQGLLKLRLDVLRTHRRVHVRRDLVLVPDKRGGRIADRSRDFHAALEVGVVRKGHRARATANGAARTVNLQRVLKRVPEGERFFEIGENPVKGVLASRDQVAITALLVPEDFRVARVASHAHEQVRDFSHVVGLLNEDAPSRPDRPRYRCSGKFSRKKSLDISSNRSSRFRGVSGVPFVLATAGVVVRTLVACARSPLAGRAFCTTRRM